MQGVFLKKGVTLDIFIRRIAKGGEKIHARQCPKKSSTPEEDKKKHKFIYFK